MLYSGKNTPEDVYIAPKDYGGYIILINGKKKNKCNYKRIRAIIAGAIRVIIFTSQPIKKDEELLYEYG